MTYEDAFHLCLDLPLTTDLRTWSDRELCEWLRAMRGEVKRVERVVRERHEMA